MNRTAIQYDDNVYFARSETVATWTDDDGVQWVSFVPTNGYNPGRAHRVRTDRVVIVELDEAPVPTYPPGQEPRTPDEVDDLLGVTKLVSRTVDVIDYRSFAECAREAGLDSLLVSDGEPPTAKVTGPRATVEAFLEAAGYEKDDVR